MHTLGIWAGWGEKGIKQNQSSGSHSVTNLSISTVRYEKTRGMDPCPSFQEVGRRKRATKGTITGRGFLASKAGLIGEARPRRNVVLETRLRKLKSGS